MKAPRDMSRAQFLAALKEHGFRKVLFWGEDTTGQCPGVSWGFVVSRSTGKVLHRATLAKLVKEREAEIAKRALDPMNATPNNNLVGPS
jgi:hypothetical protein